MSLHEAAYQHLLSLLPPGRRPTPGGTADGVVRLLGALETRLVEELLSLTQEAFPQRAEALDLHALGRMVRRIPPRGRGRLLPCPGGRGSGVLALGGYPEGAGRGPISDRLSGRGSGGAVPERL